MMQFAVRNDNLPCTTTHGRLNPPVINRLKGKELMLFITHAIPKNLLVDEVVGIGQGVLSAVGDEHEENRHEKERIC